MVVFFDNLFPATGGAEQIRDYRIQLFLNAGGSSSGTDVVLNAGAGNGIMAVAAAGFGWEAVNLVLPLG